MDFPVGPGASLGRCRLLDTSRPSIERAIFQVLRALLFADVRGDLSRRREKTHGVSPFADCLTVGLRIAVCDASPADLMPQIVMAWIAPPRLRIVDELCECNDDRVVKRCGRVVIRLSYVGIPLKLIE